MTGEFKDGLIDDTCDDPLNIGLSTKQINEILEFSQRQRAGDVDPFLLWSYNWHKFDNWTKRQGLLLLCGMEPNGTAESPETEAREGALIEFDQVLLLDLRELNRTAADIGYRDASRSTPKEIAAAYGAYYDALDSCSASYTHLLQLWESGEHNEKNPPRYYVKWAQSKGVSVPWLDYAKSCGLTSLFEDESPTQKGSDDAGRGHRHVSDKLVAVNQAAAKFWGNADPDDPSTHPSNSAVSAWLQGRGLSQSQAEKAASIIRPTWAHNGRKPDT